MRWGKIAYKLSLGFLGMLVIPHLSTNVNMVNSLAAWVFAMVFAQDAIERMTSSGDSKSLTKIGNIVEIGVSLFFVIIGFISWF